MRKPTLHQTYPDHATFNVVNPDDGSFWEVTTRDAQSNECLHWQCNRGEWGPRDLAIAGARQCAEGRGLVSVRRFVAGMPILYAVFAVQYAWGQWFMRQIGG